MKDETQDFDGNCPDRQPKNQDADGLESSIDWSGFNVRRSPKHDAQHDRTTSLKNDPKSWPSIDGYIINAYLGGGGFGDVFKAHSVKLEAPVAIKILRPQLSVDEVIAKRFQQEVKAAALTRHAHVVQVLDTGISDKPPYQGCRYLVSEYLQGGSFTEWFNQNCTSDSEKLESAVRILVGVCRGLEAIHRNDIVHRDLKPDNILLDEEGTPKIGDFGLSVLDLNEDFRITCSDQILGTLPFMAPEQILSARQAVPASDQYAVGVMLYVILCRLRPWQESANDVDERSKILTNLKSPPPTPTQKGRTVDPRLQQICLRCLQPLPKDRFPSVRELRLELEAWLNKEDSAVRRVGNKGKSKMVVAMLAIGIAFLLGIAVKDSIVRPDNKNEDVRSLDSSDSLANEKRSTVDKKTIARVPDHQASLPTSSLASQEREAAKWVLSVGGRLRGPGWAPLNITQNTESLAPLRIFQIDLTGADVSGISKIQQLPNLQDLVLNRTHIDPQELQYVISNHTIQRLGLVSTGLASNDLRLLAPLKHLSQLAIDISQVTDNWEFLEQLPSLRALEISGTNINNTKRLGEFSNLRELHFLDVTVTQESTEALNEINKLNPNLTIICGTGDSAVFVGKVPRRETARKLHAEGWKVLVSDYGRQSVYDLDSTTILDTGTVFWINNLQAPPGTKLTENHMRLFDAIGPKIEVCNLIGSSNIDQLPNVLRGIQINHLGLGGSSLNDEILTQLANHILVSSIELNNTEVTSDGVETYKQLLPSVRVESPFGIFPYEHQLPLHSSYRESQLEWPVRWFVHENTGKLKSSADKLEIILGGVRTFGDENLNHLANLLRQLRTDKSIELDIGATAVTSAGLKSLVGLKLHRIMSGYNSIDLADLGEKLQEFDIAVWDLCDGITAEAVQHLMKNPSLELCSVNLNLPPADLAAFEQWQRNLILHAVTEDHLKVAKSLRQLKTLHLQNSNFSLPQVRELANALPLTHVHSDREGFRPRARRVRQELSVAPAIWSRNVLPISNSVVAPFNVRMKLRRLTPKSSFILCFPAGNRRGELILGDSLDGATINTGDKSNNLIAADVEVKTTSAIDPFDPVDLSLSISAVDPQNNVRIHASMNGSIVVDWVGNANELQHDPSRFHSDRPELFALSENAIEILSLSYTSAAEDSSTWINTTATSVNHQEDATIQLERFQRQHAISVSTQEDPIHEFVVSIDANGNSEFNDDVLTKLAEILSRVSKTKSIRLNLDGTSITERGLMALLDVPLIKLTMVNTHVNLDALAEHLSDFQIEFWKIGSQATARSFKHLGNNPHLRELVAHMKTLNSPLNESMNRFLAHTLRLKFDPNQPPNTDWIKNLSTLDFVNAIVLHETDSDSVPKEILEMKNLRLDSER